MSVYALENFHVLNTDGVPDIFSAQYANLRFSVPSSGEVMIDAQWEANLPGLASRYLGTPYLWWVLLMYNGLEDSIADVKPGVKLKIPDQNSLLTYLRKNTSTSLNVNLNTTVL
jgi:hypothetical protein